MSEPTGADDLTVAIANAVTDYHGDEHPLVTSYVLIASFIGDDGERSIYTDTTEGQRCHETLGLLAFATAIETHRASHPDDT